MGPHTTFHQESYNKTAEHPIGTLAPCGTSIVYLPAEFEPLTVAELFTKQDGVVLITRDTISPTRNIVGCGRGN